MNMGGSDSLWLSPQHAQLDGFDTNYTPELDYLEGDSFDFENADLGGDMIGSLPTTGPEQHEKRKNTDDSGEDEIEPKRQEGEKTAKKPGRKPLTSEPTTKRKAQNRAAQRAFRERKEKHLKDLETKVSELTKAEEASKHENGLLKAKVERLQTELREYRKRLSLHSTISGGSPPVSVYSASGGSRSNTIPAANGNNFSFDFIPKFGSVPGDQRFGKNSVNGNSPINGAQQPGTNLPSSMSNRTSAAPHSTTNGQSAPATLRSLSSGSLSNATSHRSSPAAIPDTTSAFLPYSSQSNMHGFANMLPQMKNGDPFGDLFSPSILKGTAMESNNQYFPNTTANTNNGNNTDLDGGDNHSGLGRVFQFNSNRGSTDGTSPSTCSSNWNANANSSCATSPEPLYDSPVNKDKNIESYGTINDSNAMQSLDQTISLNNNNNNNNNNLAGFGNDFNVPSIPNFDPVLFGDYRESNDAIVGDGDFTGGFFDEMLHNGPYDISSPSNLFGILKSPADTTNTLSTPAAKDTTVLPSQNLIATMDKVRDGGDDELQQQLAQQANPPPPKQTVLKNNLVSCNNIWSQLQANPDFQDGKFDLDSLCSELRTKARCSESGVVVDQNHVDAALRRLGKPMEGGGINTGDPRLMFEKSSWEEMLKKLSK